MKVRQVDFIKSATKPEHFPPADLPEMAFAGRSNVGKSSLINALVNRKALAKISSTPGKTQLINFFMVEGTTGKARIVDLPGYGYAKVAMATRQSWQGMIESYLTQRPNLKVVAILIDCRRGPEEEERGLMEFLTHHGIPFELVLTKSDKLKSNEKRKLEMMLEKDVGITREHYSFTSAAKKQGLIELWKKLDSRLGL